MTSAKEIKMLTEKARASAKLAELRFEDGNLTAKQYADELREAIRYLEEAIQISARFKVEVK